MNTTQRPQSPLKQERKRQGYTQARLAAESGVSESVIYKMEVGRMPTPPKIRALADVLGVSMARLLGEEDDDAELRRHLNRMAERLGGSIPETVVNRIIADAKRRIEASRERQ